MKKKELKTKAQDMLMSQIAKVGYGELEDMEEEERDILMAEIKKQGDRIARMFGFKEMWFY